MQYFLSISAFINCELEFISLQNLKNMFMKQMKFFLVALIWECQLLLV